MQLLLDSSGPWLVAAVAQGGTVRAEMLEAGRPKLGRDIGAVVEELLAGTGSRAIEQVAVGIGPGSFIGTRVAVSFANGYAAASGAPVHAVPSLAALAASTEGDCVALRDARRDETYLHCSSEGLGHIELVPNGELAERLARWPDWRLAAEAALAGDQRGQAWMAMVEAAARRRVDWSTSIPACGLLALLSRVSAVQSAQPIYIRGFL